MPRISPEEQAAFDRLESLPEEVGELFGDWKLRDVALFWPVIRTELYAKGLIDDEEDSEP
jgi:hypothetical protein